MIVILDTNTHKKPKNIKWKCHHNICFLSSSEVNFGFKGK